ncbi:MAG: hypothetical protein DLM72_01765 [Candidatus Nitrosopolaris wilkensis]|nr:MAG: hypothetical protein DLM72_01765 [Candidatus Nitrosopolaris wilkensis]
MATIKQEQEPQQQSLSEKAIDGNGNTGNTINVATGSQNTRLESQKTGSSSDTYGDNVSISQPS